MIETIRKTCITVSFVTWGFLLAMLISEMFGAAFNPPVLAFGMGLAWLASLKYA